MSFFSQFPKVAYDFNRTGTIQQMINIFRSVRPQGNELSDAVLYKKYRVKNGARPDIVSQEIYGTPDFYWTFFIINDFLHDGLQAWPMSSETLGKYIKENYSGTAICFRPQIERESGAGSSQGTSNSVAGLLELGEIISGSRSGAVGRLIRKDADLNQIVLQDVINGINGVDPITGGSNVNIVGGGFRGTNNGSGTFDDTHTEFLNGSVTRLDNTTLFSLQTFEVYPYSEAPCYYFEENDIERRPLTSDKVIPTLQLYSELQWNKELQDKVTVGGDFNQLSLTSGSSFGGSILTNSTDIAPLTYSGGFKQEYQQYGDRSTNPLSSNPLTYISNRQKIIEQNDLRSEIQVIDPNYINVFVREFEELINV